MMNNIELIELEEQYGAHNYHPLPVVLERGQGVHVWDVEGKKYIDCLSAYSAVNQGHCHPKILQAAINQMKKLTLSSRAFHNDQFGSYAKFITEYLGYAMVLPMNTGAEGVETAMKLARKWAYIKKKVPQDKAIILACSNNFHGRTLAVISMSTDDEARRDFGPFLPGVGAVCPGSVNVIQYGIAGDLEEALETHGHSVAAFLVEPVQGEAGVVVPPPGYLKKCFDLCKQHNVLFIADEVQSGLGRTGKLLACEHDEVRPDVVILGKALSGGVYPVSAVLADKDVMLCIQPGEHGSTYGGNPVACVTAIAALQVLKDENLVERSAEMGNLFRTGLLKLKEKYSSICLVRGMGLMNAIVMDEGKMINGKCAWDVCLRMKDLGVLAKPTHSNIIRLTPPLCITREQVDECLRVIESAVQDCCQ